ncbi:MAG: OmpA family protein [Acidobacteria bacterium]|nr:OmpA family protein [Acidobacteriota bacterium]
MTYLRLIAVAALAAVVASAGCARRAQPVARVEPPPPPVVEEAPPPPPPPAPEAPPPPPAALTEEDLFARKTLEELNAEMPLGDVFFDFDRSEIRDDARPVLQRNVAWLQRWTSTRIMIEGHCDSRGTNEYNLALGERRANAVREYLVSLGVAPDRVQVVSKGEEQPFCREEGPSEALEPCWQQNRRGHFIITAK